MMHSSLSPFSEARVIVCIAAHFVFGRLVYLQQAIAAIASWPVARVHVVLMTNTASPEEHAALRNAYSQAVLGAGFSLNDLSRFRGPLHSFDIMVFDKLDDPFTLVWSHRQIMDTMFLPTAEEWSHFAYMEDDMIITREAFVYFTTYRPLLREAGLIPAFLRVESADDGNPVMATDQLRVTPLEFFRQVRAGDYVFTSMDNPYNACFIVDRELGRVAN